jgi:biopolymer transport protein ExbB
MAMFRRCAGQGLRKWLDLEKEIGHMFAAAERRNREMMRGQARTRWSVLVSLALLAALLACGGWASAQEEAPAPAEVPPPAEGDAAPAPEPAPEAAADTVSDPDLAPDAPLRSGQLSLMDMLKEGGFILWIIGALSVLTFIMAIFFFLTITTSREVPPNLVRRAHAQLTKGDLRGTYQMCEGRDELLANVIRAGVKMHGHERYVIQEAMESEGERGATALWQKISYLNNIGVIAPLLGLLGTVYGMIGAFGAIAIDDAHNRAMNMAYSVAKAMVTTAAGLMLAIPSMAVYFYLRGRVIKIIAEVEAQSSEFIELLTRSE